MCKIEAIGQIVGLVSNLRGKRGLFYFREGVVDMLKIIYNNIEWIE